MSSIVVKQGADCSDHFGQIHKANFGPIDGRISKHTESAKDMQIDRRGILFIMA